METKTCSQCNITKSVYKFYTRSSMCKKCHNAYNKEHYKKNKDKYLAKARKNEKKRIKLVQDLKTKTPCADCKRNYHYCQMDFDHIDGEKEFNISTTYKDVSLTKLMNEINKCELVCANCHRLRTFKRI